MIPRNREKNLQVKISLEEEGMIDQLTIKEDKSRSQLVRGWIRREWQKYFGEKEGEK